MTPGFHRCWHCRGQPRANGAVCYIRPLDAAAAAPCRSVEMTDEKCGARRYHRGMAERFQMDPDATGGGTADGSRTRSAALAAPLPSLPAGPYLTMFSALVRTTLEAQRVGQTVEVEDSQLTAVNSVSAVYVTEKADNQPTLEV